MQLQFGTERLERAQPALGAVLDLEPSVVARLGGLEGTDRGEAAGVIAASFAFVNLFARPLGGLLSDKLTNRKLVMLGYMVGISLGFLGMGFIDSAWPIWAAVAITVVCSMFVQGAEGATFAIIPLINKRMTGQVAGMAGAFGNVGAVIYLVVFSFVDSSTFFYILAGGAAFSVLYVALFLKEPEDAFADEMYSEELLAEEGTV